MLRARLANGDYNSLYVFIDHNPRELATKSKRNSACASALLKSRT